MNINVTDFKCVPIKKEVEDLSNANSPKIPYLNDLLSASDVNKSPHQSQNKASSVSSSNTSKSNTPKKRRRRYVYSKPKKRKKKKDTSENLVDTVNIFNVTEFGKIDGKDIHSDCSSDTIILDDLSEEVSKDSANIGNEISNMLPEEASLQPPELGKLLISDGMLLDDIPGSKKKKNAGGKSRAKSTKTNRLKKVQSEFFNDLAVAPLTTIKKEFEEVLEPPVLLPMKILPEKDTFPIDLPGTSNFFSPPVGITVTENKKRKPQTARRGKKRQISNDRTINEGPKSNILDFGNFPETSVTSKKRSPVKRNVPASVVSDFAGDARIVSDLSMSPFSNILEQNLPTSLLLDESKPKSKRKRSSPSKKKMTKKNLINLDPPEANSNTNPCSFPPPQKIKGRSPKKTTSKKSKIDDCKGLSIVEKPSEIQSNLEISVKKELNNTYLESKQGDSNSKVDFVGATKVLSDKVNKDNPSAEKNASKTYVSLSFEEDTSKKDDLDEHLSFLLSLQSKKSKNRKVKDAHCLKTSSKITKNSSDPNFKTTSILSSSAIISDSKLQSESFDENLPMKSVSNSESFLQSNAACTIGLNIANIKKEPGHISNSSIEMDSVNPISAKSLNKSNSLESSKSVVSDLLYSNTISQSSVQKKSLNIHTSLNVQNLDANLKEHTTADVAKKPSIVSEKNQNPILHSILTNNEKPQKDENEAGAMKSLKKLAKTCLSHNPDESPIVFSDISKLPLSDNNLKSHNVDIPQLGLYFLETLPKGGENISKSNNDNLNSFAFNSECVQAKTCELPSSSSSNIRIKNEPKEALPELASKTKDSSVLGRQTLHKPEYEKSSSGVTFEKTCLTNERDTSPSSLNRGKMPNTELCQMDNLSQNETSLVETSVLASASIADTLSKSRDNSVLNQKKMNELFSNNFLNTQIKKEQHEVIKDTLNVDKEPSLVSLVELNKETTTIISEKLPTSDSTNICTIQPSENNICNDANAVTSIRQTCLHKNSSNISSVPVTITSNQLFIKQEMCSNTNNSAVPVQKNSSTIGTDDISSSGSKKKSLEDPEILHVGRSSVAQVAETSIVSPTMDSRQRSVASDMFMDYVDKSFVVPSTISAMTNSSRCKSNSLISDSLHSKSKQLNDIDDDVILISDDSSSASSSASFSSDSDNESVDSLGDFEGPSKKKTRLNLTGEVIGECRDLVSLRQDSNYSLTELADVNMSESADQDSFVKYVDDHIALVKAQNKERELNLIQVESETSVNFSAAASETCVIPEQYVSNEAAICSTESTSRSGTPSSIAAPLECNSSVCEIMEHSQDSIMTSSSYVCNSKNLEGFDLLVNYRKNDSRFRQHPYPADVPIRKRKPKTNFYFRYDKEIPILNIKDIEMMLKETEKIELHAPEDPADAIKLDVYRLVPEEVECYHKLLTANTSLTLISKYHQQSTVSDEIISLPGSPIVEDHATPLSELPEKISADQNLDKVTKDSLENNESFAPINTERCNKPSSLLTTDVVFVNDINNLTFQLKSGGNSTNVTEASAVSDVDPTDCCKNVSKDFSVCFPNVSSKPELTKVASSVSAAESSTCTNTLPNSDSIQSIEITSSIKMSENSSFRNTEKIPTNINPNNLNASYIDKSENIVLLTSDAETSVSIVHSESRITVLDDKSPKEIHCNSNNPVLPMDQSSNFNSIPEQFSDFNVAHSAQKSVSNINVLGHQLKDVSSDHTQLPPMSGTLKNVSSEFATSTQIEPTSEQLPLQMNVLGCSEKDENSQTIQSVPIAIDQPILSQLDLNTSELRKILETINIFPTPKCNDPPSNLLNEETHEYNTAGYSHVSSQHVVDYGHGISANEKVLHVSPYNKEYSYFDREPLIKIPIVRDYGHKSVKDLENDNVNAYNESNVSTEVSGEVSSNIPECSKSVETPDSDEDDFCNDSELPVESSYEQESEPTLDEKEDSSSQDQDAPAILDGKEKPQYISRFQRVMERVSSKKSLKNQPSDQLLTDCFPLKSSKDKLFIKKPIALVQPCSQKLTKIPPKVKKSVLLGDDSQSIKDSIKKPKKTKESKTNKNSKTTKESKTNKNLKTTKESKTNKNSKTVRDTKTIKDSETTKDIKVNKESKKSKDESPVKSKKSKSPLKKKSIDDASSLFQPDKLVKKVESKEKSTSKSSPVKSSEAHGNRLYGRVTNRGSFLTQSSINQPPKPKAPAVKKSINKIKTTKVPTDELHSMVHSPKIDIPMSKKLPLYSNEFFKSGREFERPSFIESVQTSLSSKANFNSFTSFVRSQPKDPRTIFKNLSPEITSHSPNETSNFFAAPDPLMSPNLSTILPSVQAKEGSLPCNSPLLPNPDVRPETPLIGRKALLPSPQTGFSKRVADNDEWLPSTYSQKHSDPFRNNPVRDFESEAPLSINSPCIIGSPDMEPAIFAEQSPNISSSTHIPNRGTHHRHSRPRQSKCVCLPPKTLKASVGNAIFDTASVLLLILEWNVDWLVQQQKNHDPPPISTCIKKVVNTYEDNDEYYNTYLPLMLLETWQRIYLSWTQSNQAASPYFCEITSYSVETHSIKVQCQAVIKSSDTERGLFPEEGNIIMVKFGTKEKGGIKILGYIRDVKVKPFDASNDSINASFKCLKYTAGESLQMLLLTFSGAYSSDDFDTNQLIRIQILCNINSTLKQNEALLNLKNSPLYKNVLNPLTDGLRTVTVVSRNADPIKMNNNVSECVREIIKGILSPHPLPLLTIAKTLPSSDRLLVLPPLIEMMKNSYKTKVLLCTRTTKALTEIGYNLCGGTVKFVILGKKSDVHQKLRKYLLEEAASKKLNKELTEGTTVDEETKNDMLINVKMDILKNCDAILSLVRNCHDDLIAQACADGESIAQMCCIIDDANLCTEPEILIPLLYGISKLILIGDPDAPAKVCSKAAANFDYNRSLFHRAYELDLASE